MSDSSCKFEMGRSLYFPQITCQEEVITQFFNQMVQYVIKDMIVIEPKEKSDEKLNVQMDEKNFKELTNEDLGDAQITAVEGSKVTLTKKRTMSSLQLETIVEEKLKSSSTTTSSSSVHDSLTEGDERHVKIFFNNGNTYEGPIVNRIMNGQGKYFWTDGTVYEGEFRDGFPTGKGMMTLPDLSHYKGNFDHGLFEGEGYLNVVSTPTFYSGQWKNGKKHGQGWLLYEAEDWYEGSWFNDLKHGFGLRQYTNGAKYRGNWHEGKYEGEGIMIWENNDYYKGEWKEGAMHGQGEYIWKAFYNNSFAFPLQNIYRGSWVKGKRSGEGIMHFGSDSGAKLKGFWDHDLKHGYGRLICGNGRVIGHLLFNYDKPIKEDSTDVVSNVLDLSIFSIPELVDVGFYVDKILEKLKDVSQETLKLLRGFEERCIKNTIIRFLPQLNDLYKDYAGIAAKNELHFEPIMIRLFLWQLYKNLDVSKFGLSLADTDRVLADNPNSSLDSYHNPFEAIYFWQFLMSLIGVALTSTSLEEVCDSSSQDEGVCAFIIKNFFEKIVFVKASVSIRSPLLTYLDLVPIRAVYKFYNSIGEPHSARTLLRRLCTKKGKEPLCYLESLRPKLTSKIGMNLVPLADYVTFESFTDTDDSMEDHFKRQGSELEAILCLGPKNVVRCLAEVCPLILIDDVISNIDYPLTFLEFYETLLSCIFMALDFEMIKEKKNLMQFNVRNASKSELDKSVKEEKKATKGKKNRNSK